MRPGLEAHSIATFILPRVLSVLLLILRYDQEPSLYGHQTNVQKHVKFFTTR